MSELSDYITKHDKTHLIFDFDSTLVKMNISWPDFIRYMRDDIVKLDKELWEKHANAEKTTPFYKEIVDKHGDRGVEILLKHTPVFEMQYKDKYTKNEALLSEMERFRDKYHLYIWSSNSRELLNEILQQLRMADWFEVIVGRNDVRYLKPSPEGFELIRDSDIPLERYLLIGDNWRDEQAANAVGIDFFKEDFFENSR